MSRVTPIISSKKNNNKIIDSNISNEINIDENNIIPIINIDEPNLSLQDSNAIVLSNNISNQPTPIIDEQENLVLEMNSQGPMGPPGLTGNGIDRIEKTSTSGITDTYTIYFTNGDTFEYQITNGVVYYYDGPYEVTPMVNTTQILPTTNLVMSSDINIHEIPYSEVSNLSGGKTATIGQS